jgi:hypothetical protein
MPDQPGKAAHEILHPGILGGIFGFMRRLVRFDHVEAACVSGRIIQDLQPAFEQNVFWERHVGSFSSETNAQLRIEFQKSHN